MNVLAIEDGWRPLFEEDILRNRARNRKEQEKEAERQAAFYADGGPLDVFVGLPQEYKSAAAERKLSDNQCACVLVVGRHMHIDRRNCPLHSQAIRAAKPLCYQDPCNDPECRLDHADRETK